MIQKQITGGTFGEGFGPLQRESGTAIRQFVNNRSSQDSFNQLAAPIVDISRRETERGAADLREGFGIMGNRFGSSLATGEGQFRNDANQNLTAALSALFQSEQVNLLNGIMQMFQQGQANTAPGFGFAQQGILPEDTIVSDSPWKTGLEGLAGLIEAIGKVAPAVGGGGGA